MIFYREAGPAYRIEPHVMNVWQWYYVLRGAVRSVVDGKEFHLTSEQSMIVPPGVVRDRVYDGRSPAYMVAEFEQNGLPLHAASNAPLSSPPELLHDIHTLVSEVRNPVHADSQPLIHSLLTRILIGLARMHGTAHATRTVPSTLHTAHQDQVLARVESFLAHNFRNPISRADVARAMHLSEPHVARLYRNRVGMTLAQRVRQLRIDHAKTLLLDTTLTVTNIALEIGFDSFSHFAALFRRTVGMTPSDYRRSGGKAWP